MSTLVTANRFAPGLRQPPLPRDTSHKELMRYIADQQNMLQEQWSNLATVLQAISMQGLLSERPAAGSAGRFFYATDNSHLYYDNATSWVTVV